MSTNRKTLLLDWGIGGLSVYNELKKARAGGACVYFSDSGFTPYGKVPAEELGRRVVAVIRSGAEKYDLNQAVIACNAASTVIEAVRKEIDLPVLGMIEAGIELVKESGKKKIGVIGGGRTVDSRLFSRALAPHGFEVKEEVAQPLSALIEAGELSGPKLEYELSRILRPLSQVDALLLACTHYPAIADPIRKILPVPLLDPAAKVAGWLAARLPEAGEQGSDLFFTTGSALGSDGAARAAFEFCGKFIEVRI
jgi:glutamate racemase